MLQLSLPLVAPAPVAARQQESAVKPATLWACCYFPDVSLNVFSLKPSVAAVVFESFKGQLKVHSATLEAMAQGVQPGMTLTAAEVLCGELKSHRRDLDAEAQLLKKWADQALCFTAKVSGDFPQALLLEVGASLTLFGGLERLKTNLFNSLGDGSHYHWAVTPSPLGSWLLASENQSLEVLQVADLRSKLGKLPLQSLPIPEKQVVRLKKAGLRNLRDLWRLPVDGLARRYGQRLPMLLAQAAGEQLVPLSLHDQPRFFYAHREMPAPLLEQAHFFPAIESLVDQLISYLQQRASVVVVFELRFEHRQAAATRLVINLRQGSQRRAHLLLLIKERLSRLRLPEALLEIALRSDSIQPCRVTHADLFSHRSGGGDKPLTKAELQQTLQARLGARAVSFLHHSADHRPEVALRVTSGVPSDVFKGRQRPLWLLNEPQPINPSSYMLLDGRERIESGWWSDPAQGAAARRDYFQARDPLGRTLWLYQDLEQSGQWFLHGLFG